VLDPVRSPFAYAIVRVVPRIERGERINAGVIVYCRQRDFLAALVALDEARLAALDPAVSAPEVRAHLDAIVRIAAGDSGAGPIAALPASERFGWLVAPSSTIIQTSGAHTGLTADPRRTLENLFVELVTLAALSESRNQSE
jgi:hypothetical protein